MRHEINEFLWIETGVSGDEQQANHGNGTQQSCNDDDGQLEFTVHTHIGIAGHVKTEADLLAYLTEKLSQVTDLGLEIAFEIQVGQGEAAPAPPTHLADAWRRFQAGEDITPGELRQLDEWRIDCAVDF